MSNPPSLLNSSGTGTEEVSNGSRVCERIENRAGAVPLRGSHSRLSVAGVQHQTCNCRRL
eukprot:6570041-Pyramimonas_sp.AAC.1